MTDFPLSFLASDARTCVIARVRSARYEIDIDPATRALHARSLLELELPEAGHAVLDLVPDPSRVAIVTASGSRESSLSPEPLGGRDGQSLCRVLAERLERGSHTLAIEHTAVSAYESCAFVTSMTDKVDRRFLEQWLPIGFEHDSLRAELRIRVAGSARHELWSNATATTSDEDGRAWTLQFSLPFGSSSLFLVVAERGKRIATRCSVRGTPATVLWRKKQRDPDRERRLVAGLQKAADRLFEFYQRELPFPSLLACVRGDGMEYAGAMEISASDMVSFHELAHQYLGRWARPASGRSGWFDEAVAEWVNYECPESYGAPVGVPPPGGLAGSPWQRSTHRDYQVGCSVLARAHTLLSNSGGLAPVVRDFSRAQRVFGLADVRDALMARASGGTKQELVQLWRDWVDPSEEDHVSRKRTAKKTDGRKKASKAAAAKAASAPAARPIGAALDKMLADENERSSFESAPEKYLRARGVDDAGQRVVLTLDAGVISAFVRAEEALSYDEADQLRARLRAQLEAVANKAAWPDPRASVASATPATAVVGAVLDVLTVRGSGLTDGALVSLTLLADDGTPHPEGIRRDWRASAKKRASYMIRTLRIYDVDLRGLPAGVYELAVASAVGLPRVRSRSPFVITPR